MKCQHTEQTKLSTGAAFASAGILTLGLMTATPPSDAFKSESGSLHLTVAAFSPMAYSSALLQRFDDSSLLDLPSAAVTTGTGVPSARASTSSSIPVQQIPAASIASEAGQSWLATTLVAVCAITVVCGVVAVGLIVGSVVLAPVLYPVLKLVLPVVAKIRDAIAGLLGLPLPSSAAVRIGASAKPGSRTRATAGLAATTSKRARPSVVAAQDRSHRTASSGRTSTVKPSGGGRQLHGSR